MKPVAVPAMDHLQGCSGGGPKEDGSFPFQWRRREWLVVLTILDVAKIATVFKTVFKSMFTTYDLHIDSKIIHVVSPKVLYSDMTDTWSVYHIWLTWWTMMESRHIISKCLVQTAIIGVWILQFLETSCESRRIKKPNLNASICGSIEYSSW